MEFSVLSSVKLLFEIIDTTGNSKNHELNLQIFVFSSSKYSDTKLQDLRKFFYEIHTDKRPNDSSCDDDFVQTGFIYSILTVKQHRTYHQQIRTVYEL